MAPTGDTLSATYLPHDVVQDVRIVRVHLGILIDMDDMDGMDLKGRIMGVFDLRKQTLAGAVVTWLVPLLVSFGLVDPSTGTYVPGYAGFKLIMAALAALCTVLTYRWIARSGGLPSGVPVTYLALNSVLDLGVLVAGIGMPLAVWAGTVFPVYPVVFFGLHGLLRPRA